jgi:hypothetical protein
MASKVKSQIKFPQDGEAHSELGVLITYDNRAKPVERSEPECRIWWFAFREHTFKIK